MQGELLMTIQHLLGGDDFDLVRIDVEAEFVKRDVLAGVVDALEC